MLLASAEGLVVEEPGALACYCMTAGTMPWHVDPVPNRVNAPEPDNCVYGE